jgi:hypothetical protein
MPLRNQPKEVVDSIFSDLTDTLIATARGRVDMAETTIFDEDGNVRYLKRSPSPDQSIVVEKKYSSAGLFSKTYSITPGNKSLDTFRSDVRPFSAEKFLYRSAVTGPDVAYRLIAFQEDGNLVVEESITDTLKPEKVYQTQLNFYKKGRSQKVVMDHEDGTHQELIYYYTKDVIDSVIFVSAGKVINRRTFANNKEGDPVRIIETNASGDVLSLWSASYIYDGKGNWTRKLERKDPAPNRILLGTQEKNSSYSLTIRKIIYR